MKTYNINSEDIRRQIPNLHCGDRVLLTGTIYTSRDAAHKEIFSLLDSGGPLPFELKDAIIYYAGPTPGHDGMPTGSCGPTTSSRMDAFAPRLYSLGLAATIGKGDRSDAVQNAIIQNGGIYLCAVGGAGALMAQHIETAEEIAFPHLGCESVKRLTVRDLPLTVAIDCHGGNLFKNAIEKYRVTV